MFSTVRPWSEDDPIRDFGHLTLHSEWAAFEQPLIAAIKDYSVNMIAEEFPFEVESIVSCVARRMQLPYLQIDMHPGEQITRGIYEELRRRNECLPGEDCRLSHADEIREMHWLDKIEAWASGGRVLVVCGYLHLNYLAEKAAARGCPVKKRIFSPPSLDRKPSVILSPAELDEFCNKNG